MINPYAEIKALYKENLDLTQQYIDLSKELLDTLKERNELSDRMNKTGQHLLVITEQLISTIRDDIKDHSVQSKILVIAKNVNRVNWFNMDGIEDSARKEEK